MSIALVTPPEITSVLGGSATVAYDKLILDRVTYDVLGERIVAKIRIVSTAEPEMQALVGEMTADAKGLFLKVSVEKLDFSRLISLSSSEAAALKSIIFNGEDTLEQSLISIGLISGTHSPGP